MNNLEINKKVQQKLHEFETMKTISASDNWDAELTSKLYAGQSVKPNYSKSYGLILVILTLINISFITYSFIGTTEKKETTHADFQMVSNELLITSNN